MARLHSIGYELNTTGGIELTATTGGPVISSSTFRSGAFSLSIPSLTTLTAKGHRQQFVTAAANGPYFFRVYLRVDTLPSTETAIIQLNDTNDFSAAMVYITLDGSGLLALFDEDGQIGSDSSALSTGTWYRIELEFDRTAAAGSHVVKARIDGTEFAAATNRDLSAGIQSFNVGGNLDGSANAVGAWFFDDLAINDSTGSFQTSYPGEGELICLRPNAAGDNADWTRGGTDSGANWSQCDETTPNDITDYVQSNTSGQIDDYNLEATPAAMASDDVINVVHVGARLRVDDATGADPSFVLRVKASSGGTVEESSNISTGNTNWRSNTGAGLINFSLTLYDLPGASTTAWTKADLDQAQVGIRESVSDTHNVQISALWLLVEHKPGTPKSLVYNPHRRAMSGLLPR